MRRNVRIVALLLTIAFCFVGCNNDEEINVIWKETTEQETIEKITTVMEEETESEKKETKKEVTEEKFKDLIVIAPKVNLRKEPNADSKILDVYYKNTIVNAAEIDGKDWCKILCEDGEFAYMSSKYLNDIAKSEMEEYLDCQLKEKNDLHGIIFESSANVRLTPNITTGAAIASLPKGSLIDIVGVTKNDWFAISYNSDIYYVSNEVAKTITEEEYQIEVTKLEKGNFDEKNVTLLGSYTTDYSPAATNRGYNVELASSQIDLLYIPVGATFNWCRDMGACGKDEGYKSSQEIMNGQYVTGYGGGICQVSSTLCAAVIESKSNFEFIQRRKHSKAQKYILRELDATVSYPNVNFVFKNNNDFPVILKSYCSNGKVTVEIYKTK